MSNQKKDGINLFIRLLKVFLKEYEDSKFKITKSSPAEILQELMDQHGLTQSDLKDEIGAQPHVSRILRGERELTTEQIKKLSKRFNGDPSIFI
ncbi:MAG: helix-turn-helix domain-containing protein [Oligoflexales bacterium]|nr:helix-turn-helix domain-containing protein [Oligoflexales bacterium]